MTLIIRLDLYWASVRHETPELKLSPNPALPTNKCRLHHWFGAVKIGAASTL